MQGSNMYLFWGWLVPTKVNSQRCTYIHTFLFCEHLYCLLACGDTLVNQCKELIWGNQFQGYLSDWGQSEKELIWGN